MAPPTPKSPPKKPIAPPKRKNSANWTTDACTGRSSDGDGILLPWIPSYFKYSRAGFRGSCRRCIERLSDRLLDDHPRVSRRELHAARRRGRGRRGARRPAVARLVLARDRPLDPGDLRRGHPSRRRLLDEPSLLRRGPALDGYGDRDTRLPRGTADRVLREHRSQERSRRGDPGDGVR